MKGEIIYKILDTLENRVMATFDFFDAIISAGYGASFGKLQYEHKKRLNRRLEYKLNREIKRKLQKYISKLKSSGLISENSSGQVLLSKRGKKKLAILKQETFINKHNYKKQENDKVIVISYDIPVTFNTERKILVDILKRLGFNPVHKSVWVGKVKLPKQFIIDLGKLGILDYIEILEVTKSGSLKSYN